MAITQPGTTRTIDVSRGMWQGTLFVGVITLILGLIVCFNPTGTLKFVAVLVGIMMVLSGIFNLVRVFDPNEPHRVWMGIAGLVWIIVGVIMIRDLNLTLAVIGLIVGLVWIVQGIAALIAGISGGSREGRWFWIIFGVISVIAGIVLVSVPVHSLTALAVLLGIWFVVIGVIEIAGAFMFRRSLKAASV
jgi:uncharacterized membrane protein HdeD (DUF308 family)